MTKLSKEDRNIILADLWEKLREGTEAREGLVQEIAEAVRDHRPLGHHLPGTLDSTLSNINGPYMTYGEVPLGLEYGVDEEWSDDGVTEIQVTPPGTDTQLYIPVGVRSFNKPGEIWVLEAANNPRWGKRAGFDSAAYSLDHGAFKSLPVERHLAYYRTWWNAFSYDNPLVVRFRHGDRAEPDTKLRWTIYGVTVEQLPSSCGVLPPE